MNTACPRCGVPRDPSSRFCTNCGADLAAPIAGPAAVPSWASVGPVYQQQQPWTADSALGLASGLTPNQKSFIKKALTLVVVSIAVALIVLVGLGILAAYIPQFRCLFFIAIAVVILVPWWIYATIKRSIRRTVGRVERLWWLWLS